MPLTRFNAVGLVTGAASGLGATCAPALAKISPGGIILVDADENALDAVADELDDSAPERVSMLAFDIADADRWAQAIDFIQSQYGRIDWAIINAASTPAEANSDLVEWRRVLPAQLEAVLRTLRVLMPLMARNTLGGSIVVLATASALAADKNVKAGLAQLVRAAGVEAAAGKVRVNAVVTEAAASPVWKKTPSFSDLVKQARSEAAAHQRLAKLSSGLVRHNAGAAELAMLLLADESEFNGATLLVDEADQA